MSLTAGRTGVSVPDARHLLFDELVYFTRQPSSSAAPRATRAMHIAQEQAARLHPAVTLSSWLKLKLRP